MIEEGEAGSKSIKRLGLTDNGPHNTILFITLISL